MSEHLSTDSKVFVSIGDILMSWRALTEKKHFDVFAEGLNSVLQSLMMSVSNGDFYISHGRTIFECLSFCKDNNHVVLFGFEDWLKDKIFKAVKWHLDHNNAPRYSGCLSLMLDMNLTNNEYFYFLKAEMARNSGEVYLAADFYNRALDYKNYGFVERLNVITTYWQKLWNDEKILSSNSKANIITPTKTDDEKDLIFDEKTKSFVKLKNET